MTRTLSLLVAATFVIASVEANAQGTPTSVHQAPDHHAPSFGHGHHTPDVHRLIALSDALVKIGRHLHDDAHNLSQDYAHSREIESYVDQVVRLQRHMHQVLHDAERHGYQPFQYVGDIKLDVRKTKLLLSRLDNELSHQNATGVRTSDYYTITHMRHVISHEAFPWVRKMEVALYGYALYDHSLSTGERQRRFQSSVLGSIRSGH